MWSCRGLDNTSTVQLISKIAETTNLSILFLMETKQKKGMGKYWTHKWNFENFCEVERVGLFGGLLLCWKNINLFVLDASKNFIHTRMKHPTFGLYYFSFVYGHPKTSKRRVEWNQLVSFQENINGLGVVVSTSCYPMEIDNLQPPKSAQEHQNYILVYKK